MEASEKAKTYGPEEVEAKLKEHGLDDWTSRATGSAGSTTPTAGRRRWPSTPWASSRGGRAPRRLSVTWGKPWVKLAPLGRRHHRQRFRAGAADRGHGAVEARRRFPAGGHAEQVRLRRARPRPARLTGRRPPPAGRRDLFVTGKLAAPALRTTLERSRLPEYEVAVMRITVAALMTTAWIAKHLADVWPGRRPHRHPGAVRGRPAVISGRLDIPAEKGPADLKRLPAHFGQPTALAIRRARYSDVRRDQQRPVPRSRGDGAAAEYYRDAGADVIDLGSPSTATARRGPEVVACSRRRGFTLSIDTLDPTRSSSPTPRAWTTSSASTARTSCRRPAAGHPGADPRHPDDLGTLDPTVARLRGARPALHPRSGHRADRLRLRREPRPLSASSRRYPDAEMLMGIGNFTELTDADSAGSTRSLLGFCQELGIRSVLTTEVIMVPQRVREVDVARQLMYDGAPAGRPPEAHRRPSAHDQGPEKPAQNLHRARTPARCTRAITDPNFRIATHAGRDLRVQQPHCS